MEPPRGDRAEEDGTLTNLEGRVLRRRRALDPPVGVRSELEIWAAIADRLGRGKYFPTDPREVYDELRRASAGGVADYAGISWERLDAGEQLFWPCPNTSHPGTPRMFTERFGHPDGRARFVAVTARPVVEPTDAEFPYLLTTGRSRTHYQSGTQTRRSPTLAAAEPSAYAEIHPDLARRLGVDDGEEVRLTTRRGSTVVRVRLTDTLRRDTVFAPFHWPGINDLTDPRLDPTSRMPEFKACAVAVSPIDAVATPAVCVGPVRVPHHEESSR